MTGAIRGDKGIWGNQKKYFNGLLIFVFDV